MTRSFRTLLCASALGLLAACGTSDAPDDHTIDKDGAMHKPGLEDATANCTECHGEDLRGGEGKSCFECHGQLWR